MASTSPGGADGVGPIFDSLAKFYVSAAIVWTSAILAGSAFLIVNREEQCIRIRNLFLALSAVACLHVYWILCMVAYSMGDKYPCVAEYWIMSIYLPLGIALFQANSMQLLSVFGIQEKLLFGAQQPYRPHLADRAKFSKRSLFQWKQLNLVQRTELGIAVGMVVQVSASSAPAALGVHLLISHLASLTSCYCRSLSSSHLENSKPSAHSLNMWMLLNVGEVLNGFLRFSGN
ncbi:unnamed protein product [Penicillium glandicola]